MPTNQKHGEEEGPAHANEEGDFVDAVAIYKSRIDPGIMTNTRTANWPKKMDNRTRSRCLHGCLTGGSFPEHAQDEGRKYAGADIAGIFLNEGISAIAADPQDILPGEENGRDHRQQDSQASCPHHLFSLAPVLMYFL